MKVSLRAARVNANLSQDEVAKRLRKTPQTVVNWEKGRTRIDAANFRVLCEMYGATQADIVLPYSLCSD